MHIIDCVFFSCKEMSSEDDLQLLDQQLDSRLQRLQGLWISSSSDHVESYKVSFKFKWSTFVTEQEDCFELCNSVMTAFYSYQSWSRED